jgi:hypothetical protein
MSIQIRYRKIIVNEEKRIQITHVEAPCGWELPPVYTKGYPHCHKAEAGFLVIRDPYWTYYLDPREAEEDNIMSMHELQMRLMIVRECEQRLKSIDGHIPPQNVGDWHGETTVII